MHYFHSLESQRPFNMNKNILFSLLVLFFAELCVNGASVSKMEAQPENGDNLTEVEVKTQPNVATVEVQAQPNVAEAEVKSQPNVTEVEVKSQPNVTEVKVKSQPKVTEIEVKSQPNITEVEVKPQLNVTEVKVKRQPRFFPSICNAFCAGVNFAPILCPLGFFWAPVIFCNDIADAGVAALIGAALIIG